MNTQPQANVATASNFLWTLARRYAEIHSVNLDDILEIKDITAFDFYGDVLVFSAPSLTNGEYSAAREFAKEHGLRFKAANAEGESWKISLPAINDAGLDEAFKLHKELGGREQERETWEKDRLYFRFCV